MKKIIAFLLLISMLLSALSCDTEDKKQDLTSKSTDENNEATSDVTEEESDDDSESSGPIDETDGAVLETKKYYEILGIELTSVQYTIYDMYGNIALKGETDRPLTISMMSPHIVDIAIGMGTGVCVHTYYDVINDRFSEEYTEVIAASGNLVAYVTTSEVEEGNPFYESSGDRFLIVRDIFDKSVFYKAIGVDFSPTVIENLVQSAHFTEGENELEVTYYSETPTTLLTSTFSIREPPDAYNEIIDLYRSVIDFCTQYVDSNEAVEAYLREEGITQADKKALFSKLLGSAYLFYPGRGAKDSKAPAHKLSCGYAIKDLNGDGINELVFLNDDYRVIALFTAVDGQAVLLDHYIPRGSCWIGGDGLLHRVGSGGADVSSHTVYKIVAGEAAPEALLEFGMDGHEWIDNNAVVRYYKTVNGEKQPISESEYQDLTLQSKYLGLYAGPEATKSFSGLKFTSLYPDLYKAQTEAMSAFQDVLNGSLKVRDTAWNEDCYLKDCETPYDRTPLHQAFHLEYAYADLDRDAISELVISCDGDTMILRYYDGVVYLYSFTFRNLYNLNTDGSYSWNHNGQDFEYGEMQLYFDGTQIKSKELYRIVNDGKPNVQYFVEGEQVTAQALFQYTESRSAVAVEFIPFSINKVSPAQALEIAKQHWAHLEIEKNGYVVLWANNDQAPDSVYVFVIKWLVTDHHYSTFDEIWIDVNTGVLIIPYENKGK